MDEEQLLGLPVLAVDDEQANVLLLQRILERAGFTNVIVTQNPEEVLEICESVSPQLLFLDLHMPRLDGFELLELLGHLPEENRPPVLVLTADAGGSARRRALILGARDFVTKPFDREEVLLRARALLRTQWLQQRLASQNAELEGRVRERTTDLEDAQLEILDRLALAAEYRDNQTQEHARRIARTSYLLAAGIGISVTGQAVIARAAPLHDIGKIGIPDSILLKPGRLTAAEFDRVKQHTTIGAALLADSSVPVVRLAEQIALTHHERWDGTGYPSETARDVTPLAGRIVAIADVFDALISERPYKAPWPVERAVDEIIEQAGSQFDPSLTEVFAQLDHEALTEPVHAADLPGGSLGDVSEWQLG